MSTTIKNPITGKDKAIITDNCIYSTITGRKIAYVENGKIISVLTGKPISVVATDSNGESIDLTNLVAGNIKSGVTINGITGTFTNDATAVSADIRSGKTAYVKGSLVTGNMQNVSLYQDGYLTVAINSGYSVGGSLTLTDSNLIASNILQGKTIFGVSGSIDLTNLLPENIKKDVVINGVIGNYSATKTFVYTITGQNPEDNMPVINGNYYEVTGDDIPQGIQALGTPLNYPVYTNGFGSFLFVFDSYGTGNSYNIGFAYGNQSSQVKYFYIKGSDGLNPIGGNSSYWMLSGTAWTGTVSAYQDNNGGSNGGGSGSNADYIVSGAVSYPEVNGEYVQDGEYNGKPKYINTTSNATYTPYIQCDSLLGWAIFYPNQPRYSTNDTTSATPPTEGWSGITVTQG